MTIAVGVNKSVRYKVESAWGTAPSASGAQLLRRVSSGLALQKDPYESGEIRTDYQIADYRHGVRRVSGNIEGELSPASYADFFAAALRQDFAIGATTGALATLSVTNTGTKYTRSSGSFVTDGFKVGDVVSATGFATANNNSHYGLVTAVAALTLTVTTLDGVVLTDEAAGATVTIAVVGKKTYTPTSGHTDKSFTIEEYFSDTTQSELYTGCKVSSVDVALPPSGMAKVTFGFMGKDLTASGTEYFTSPTAANSNGVLAAVNGLAFAVGSRNTVLTGLSIKVDGNMSSDPVVGSNTVPDLFEGRVKVTGEMSAYFENGTLRDAFINETEVALMFVFTTGSSKNADFVSFVMPRVKLGGANKDDGDKGIVQTIPYQALFNSSGTGADKTTLIIQDSLA